MKFNKFVAKHKVLALILINGVEFLALVLICNLYRLDVMSITLPCVLLFEINLSLALSVEAMLLRGPTQMLNMYCDPDEFYNITKELLTYRLSKAKRCIMLINYAVALSDKGEYEQALDILKSLDIYDRIKKAPILGLVYYHNLASMYFSVKNMEQAKKNFQKSIEIYDNLARIKFRQQYAQFSKIDRACVYICDEEYSKAVALLDDKQNYDMRFMVGKSYICAKAYLALGENEKAREKLNFVLVNGNRLHIVKLAKQLLDNMQNNVN